jgi:hypothetical protein
MRPFLTVLFVATFSVVVGIDCFTDRIHGMHPW